MSREFRVEKYHTHLFIYRYTQKLISTSYNSALFVHTLYFAIFTYNLPYFANLLAPVIG